jgi:aspartyl-tRNA synthetase
MEKLPSAAIKTKTFQLERLKYWLDKLEILNKSELPPFTIENETDGGDELRMKYRYLDIRRNPVKNNLMLRHQMAIETRNFLNQNDFLEIETPELIKSTPEGARDFVVPSRMHPGAVLCLTTIPTNIQTTFDGWRFR